MKNTRKAAPIGADNSMKNLDYLDKELQRARDLVQHNLEQQARFEKWLPFIGLCWLISLILIGCVLIKWVFL